MSGSTVSFLQAVLYPALCGIPQTTIATIASIENAQVKPHGSPAVF